MRIIEFWYEYMNKGHNELKPSAPPYYLTRIYSITKHYRRDVDIYNLVVYK